MNLSVEQFVLPLLKNYEHGGNDQNKAQNVIPLYLLVEIQHRENREHGKRYDFLDGLQLHRAELIGSNAIGGDLKAIFKERDPPTDEDYFEQGRLPVLQVAVPGECHENV
jgi:hypothetical protein